MWSVCAPTRLTNFREKVILGEWVPTEDLYQTKLSTQYKYRTQSTLSAPAFADVVTRSKNPLRPTPHSTPHYTSHGFLQYFVTQLGVLHRWHAPNTLL